MSERQSRVGELLMQLFHILQENPDGIPANQALRRLESAVTLTPFENSRYEGGSRRFEKIVRFATVSCVKAGWMLKVKGVWFITEEGSAALIAHPNPNDLYRAASKMYRSWKQTARTVANEYPKSTASEVSDVDDVEPEELESSVTFEQAEEQAAAEIDAFLAQIPPFEFQQLVADLLLAMEYHVTWIAPPGKDGGVDIIAHTDPLGTRPPRIKVQVKRQQQKVDIAGLKSFLAIINNDDVGLFVCTGGFTRDAEEYARSQESRKITLINSDRLVGLWIQYYSQLDELARRRFPLTPIYFLTPEV